MEGLGFLVGDFWIRWEVMRKNGKNFLFGRDLVGLRRSENLYFNFHNTILDSDTDIF